SGRGKAPASRRSCAARGRLGKNSTRTRLAPEVPKHRRHHRERLALAPKISERLRRLIPKKTPAENTLRGCFEFRKSTNDALRLRRLRGRSRGGRFLFDRRDWFGQRDF